MELISYIPTNTFHILSTAEDLSNLPKECIVHDFHPKYKIEPALNKFHFHATETKSTFDSNTKINTNVDADADPASHLNSPPDTLINRNIDRNPAAAHDSNPNPNSHVHLNPDPNLDLHFELNHDRTVDSSIHVDTKSNTKIQTNLNSEPNINLKADPNKQFKTTKRTQKNENKHFNSHSQTRSNTHSSFNPDQNSARSTDTAHDSELDFQQNKNQKIELKISVYSTSLEQLQTTIEQWKPKLNNLKFEVFIHSTRLIVLSSTIEFISQILLFVSSQPIVIWIEQKMNSRILNNEATATLQSGRRINATRIFQQHNLRGSGQMISIGDNILDTSHCFLTYFSLPHCAECDISNTTFPCIMHTDQCIFPSSNTKIAGYRAYTDIDYQTYLTPTNSHGTHVTGSICGMGAGKLAGYSGQAPNAQLVFTQLGAVNPGDPTKLDQIIAPPDLYTYKT
jgi:subtilisin family serine protease